MSRALKILILLSLCAIALLHDYLREGFNFPAASVIVLPMIGAGFWPRRAWLWGVIAGLAGAVAMWAFSYWTKGALPSNAVAALVGIVPALAAAYTGAWISRLLHEPDVAAEFTKD